MSSSGFENLFTKDEIIFEADDDHDDYLNECSNQALTLNCSPTAGLKRNKELEDKIRHQEILIEDNETQCTNLYSQLESVQDNCISLNLKNKSLEKNLIVLRQERDEINSALFDGKQEIARLLNVEQEKQALLCELNNLLENLQTQEREMKSIQVNVDDLQKELCANATSYNEKEISYVDELASCREIICHLEDQLDDHLKVSSEQNSLQHQTSFEMTNQIGSLDSELLSSSTVALCVQISAMLVTYSATKFSLNTPVQSERQVVFWQGECDENELFELPDDTQSKEGWQAENLESELSKTNFWCPVSAEEPQLNSSIIANPPKPSLSGKFDDLHLGTLFKTFLSLILLAILWFLMDFPLVEFSLRVGEFFYIGIGNHKK